jgi:hypothetical protein
MTARYGSDTTSVLRNVMVYGTSWPRVTLMSGEVLVMVMALSSFGSTGMWLLNSWL